MKFSGDVIYVEENSDFDGRGEGLEEGLWSPFNEIAYYSGENRDEVMGFVMTELVEYLISTREVDIEDLSFRLGDVLDDPSLKISHVEQPSFLFLEYVQQLLSGDIRTWNDLASWIDVTGYEDIDLLDLFRKYNRDF